jgi:hypothetical protein
VALFMPLFLWAVVHRIRNGDESLGAAIGYTAFFVVTGVASGVFWFG